MASPFAGYDGWECPAARKGVSRLEGPHVEILYLQPIEKGIIVRRLFVVAVVLLVGIAGLGFYQGWFRYSTDKRDDKVDIRLTVDEQKFRADEEKAKDLGRKAKEEFGDRTDKANDQPRQP